MSEEKRVSISYTVDLEEVPQRVELLLAELGQTLIALSEISKEAAITTMNPGDTDNLSGLKAIHRLKVLLGKAQERSDDCFNILKGYIVMSHSPVPPPEPKTPPAPEPKTPPAPEPKVQKAPKKKAAKKKVVKKKVVKEKKEE